MDDRYARKLGLLFLGVIFIAYANLIIFNAGSYILLPGFNFIYNAPFGAYIVSAILYWLAFVLFFDIERENSNKYIFIVAMLGFMIIIGSMFSFLWTQSPQAFQHYFGGYTDAYVLQYSSAKALLNGTNPYTANFTAAIASQVPGYFRTYTNSTNFVHVIDYPAFSFLYYLPAAYLNVPGVYQDIILLVLLALILYSYAETDFLKIAVIVFILLDYNFILFVVSSITDIAWVFLISVALILLLRKHKVAPFILIGLAASYKPEALFAIPFLLIMTYKEFGMSRFKWGLLIMLVTIAIVNLPFFISNPHAFVSDIALVFSGSVFGNFTSGGVGLSLLVSPPSIVFDALLAISVIVSIVLYLKKYENLSLVGIGLLPMIILWFNSRSLQDYFLFFPIFILIMLLSHKGRKKKFTQRKPAKLKAKSF